MRCWRVLLLLLPLTLSGCIDGGPSSGRFDMTWGRRGISEGRLQKPRAIAIDDKDQLYIVDMTARIQVFSPDGEFIRQWRTPEHDHGNPCGMSFGQDGNLLVADTHYFRMLVYTPEGKLLEEKTIGGTAGHRPGEFGFVTDAVQDSRQNYYIAEYGDYARIQKFSPEGEFVYEWGSHGENPEQFNRPQGLAVDSKDQLWVADACNHRIQVFDVTGDEPKLVKIWGSHGKELGQLRYPYGIVLDGKGHLYVAEYGNHRVQKFTLDGESLGAFGAAGKKEGQFYQPWSLAMDTQGRIHILDTYNHRVQRIRL